MSVDLAICQNILPVEGSPATTTITHNTIGLKENFNVTIAAKLLPPEAKLSMDQQAARAHG